MLKATLREIGVISIVVAEGFSGDAPTAGHAAGIMVAMPKDLFGRGVGVAAFAI
jgi:hypothetical protein